jgi:hypothetical protein
LLSAHFAEEPEERETYVCQLCVYVWHKNDIILSEKQGQVWLAIDCWHGQGGKDSGPLCAWQPTTGEPLHGQETK